MKKPKPINKNFDQLSLFDLTQWKNDKKEEPKKNDKEENKNEGNKQ